jgi:ankyrin repeat protein
MTGLHMAASGGHVLVVSRLASLQLGLDINKVDTWGYTPLDQAIATEQWPCVTLLLALGGALPLSSMLHMRTKLKARSDMMLHTAAMAK